ncbi:GNAT family N-acetyltransferase [Amycolatopsis sp. CB00013]|uniref:GNAT family N-acetyltransferase n=1 Tax=Amycolatopsis sp. CB00013 TaxID=1703945 RepID=UPI0009402340|nr:GNAT family N-acetyltransferase [Amycolatopsis sp. CB00013]OKJ97877.1 hypothetical protein AMK34_13070 [Amycolatopsis sp. CB00013]
MRFRPQWLRRVLHVPYVPTLGPVHPDTFEPAVFDEVLSAAAAGVMLPFDKESRWSATKSETVLTDEIVHRPDLTIIPALTRRGKAAIKTYVYSQGRPDIVMLREATRRWRVAHGARAGRLVWFHPGESATTPETAPSTTRILLKAFDASPAAGVQGTAHSVVLDLDRTSAPVRATFRDFAGQLPGTGFEFLHRRWCDGLVDGPILVAVADERIVGAIGPLATMADRHGATAMLPQYFGVLAEYRGHGHGRALWRYAAAWAERHLADYQLLQTVTGGPADGLFRSEGLSTLGFATTVAA